MKTQEEIDKDMEELSEISDKFNAAMKLIEEEQEEYWNSLSKEDQLKAFCAVVRRIHKADIEDKGTYRYALYNVFEFGPEAYVQAQMAGYLSLHNSIFDYKHERDTMKAFAKSVNIDESKVDEFYKGKYL